MKTTLYSIIAAAAACGLASAAETAYTTPVGYETIALTNGVEYNIVGVRLQQPAVAAGVFSAVGTNLVSDSSVDFTALLTVGTTYILEINDGSFAGVVQEVVSWGTASGNTVNDLVTSADLSAFPVTTGTKYSLRTAPTLEQIFGTTTLLTGFSASQADLVWVPDGSGGYTKYFISSLVGNPWKNAATSANTPNVPVVYQDGLLIQKRATSPTTSLVISGEVKTEPTVSVLLAGIPAAPSYNTLGTVYPAGSTLQNSGITTNLITGFSASQADLVWVPDGSGGYTKYFVSSLIGNPIKNAATSANVTDPVPLPSGVLVERKGSAVNIGLTPPPSYLDL